MHSTTTQPINRVVIVGGGFAGLRAAKELAKDDRNEITLIDRTNHHLMQPLLYQVATGLIPAGSVAPSFRSIFRKNDNVHIRLSEVTDFDLDAQQVITQRGTIDYDTLIVAAGAGHSYFGKDEWAQYAPGMKTLGDAAKIRTRILSAFELGEQATTDEERAQYSTFVIVGGGPTGVELAGQVAQLAHGVLAEEFHNLDSKQSRIVILDAGPSVLAPFDPTLQVAAKTALMNLGVEVINGALVNHIDANGVTAKIGDEEISINAKTVLWAAGVAASPLSTKLAHAAGVEITDRAGRLPINDDLTVGEYKNVFALGDMVFLDGVPGVAQPAMQEGSHVAQTIRARLDDRAEPGAFVYKDKGSMATIGKGHAVAQIGKFKLTGRPAFLMWGTVHLAALIGTGNRLETLLRWSWSAAKEDRRERIISSAQIREM